VREYPQCGQRKDGIFGGKNRDCPPKPISFNEINTKATWAGGKNRDYPFQKAGCSQAATRPLAEVDNFG